MRHWVTHEWKLELQLLNVLYCTADLAENAKKKKKKTQQNPPKNLLVPQKLKYVKDIVS